MLQFDTLNLPPGQIKYRDSAPGSRFVTLSACGSRQYLTGFLSELRYILEATNKTAIDVLLEII